MSGQSNIDDVRARIMALESATMFDQRAWEMVFADLRAAGRMSALADAERRMETAKGNATCVVGFDVGSADGDKSVKYIVKLERSISGHHTWTVNGKRVETWSDYDHCLRCGHPLTSPYSRQRGYGEECEKHYFPSGPVIALKIVAVETEVAA
ncbi:MAG: hypothetical protein HY865_09505 [Chloroflexi bacterium]|nr:hypothetical protein [Chloroflexota bacterium]